MSISRNRRCYLTTFAVRRSATSPSARPSTSRSTQSVCWPLVGATSWMPAGVPDMWIQGAR